MLEIKNLTLQCGNKKILDDINLSVEKGEVIVLTGCSGSGKSSLLRTLNGLLPEIYEGEVSGSIRLNGEELIGSKVTSRSRHISTVFQNPKTQFYCINTTDEMIFAMENRAFDKEDIRIRLDKYTEELGTRRLLDRNIFGLSGGEKQMIAITGVAMVENSLYLLDEPSSSLDYKGIEKLKNAIINLKKKGKTVIVAEHRLYYLMDIADKLAILENGKLEVFQRKRHIGFEEDIGEKYCLRSFSEIKREEIDNIDLYNIKLLKGMDKSMEGDCISVKDEIALSCKDFLVKYGNRTVLQGDFHFGRGIYFIIGENGVGKTTFINRLTGINKGRGQVFYKNRRVKRASDIMCLVMQDVNYQIFTESVWSEISIVSSDDDKKEKILKEIGLYEKRDEHPQILSGGEKQRLMIGLALACEKPVVILDEPTSGLCRKQMIATVRFLHELEKSDKTVIVITHDMELIKECGGTVYNFL